MIKKEYNSYVLELKECISRIINTKGKFLIIADTGGGKTYAILTIFKELSKLNSNKVYVIACPNRSQNEQNEKSYSVYAVVGGKAINEGVLVASMVYDKAKEMKEYIVKNGKELVLVVDEAHQIIDSCIFRKNALQHLIELESISTTVIHLTATPEKLLCRYEYDQQYVFSSKYNKTNIKEHSLIVLNNDDIIAQLLQFIKVNKKKEKKAQLIFLNNLGVIKQCYKQLESQNFKVGVIANGDKIKEKFNLNLYSSLMSDRGIILESIRKKSIIPDNYDFIFSTDIISCGVNLLNTNITMINCLLSPLDIDGDNIKQRTSRPREKIERAFTVIRNVEEQKPVKEKEIIFNAVECAVKKYQREYQKVFDFHKNMFGLNVAINHIESILKADINKKLYYSALEVEEGKIIINQTTLVKAKFKEYYKQFYFNHKELNNLLKEKVKADKFLAIRINDISSEEERQDLKEIRKEIEEEKEELKDQARKILERFKNNDTNFLNEYLSNGDIFTDLPKELQRNIKILEAEKTLLKLLKEFILENIQIKKAIEVILNSKTKKEAKDYVKRHNYVNRNIMGDPLQVSDEYTVYRRVFDEVMKKRGRITKDKLIELIKKCIICKIKKGKEREKFLKLLETLEKEKKISEANTTKLLKPLAMIYNLSYDDKQFPKIYSLNCKFK